MPSDQTYLLPSLTNFRDLGGISLGDRRLKQGLFYRSPRLTDLSAADMTWLEQRNIDVIVDFRGVTERAAAPLTLGSSMLARRRSIPIEPSMAERLRQLTISNQHGRAAAVSAMTASYRDYVRQNLDAYASFLQTCAETKGAVVFHCSAGKDRTGFAAALLLQALGASWDDILSDYLRTRTDWRVPSDLRAEAEAAGQDLLLGVEPDYLEATFDELGQKAQSAKNFAQQSLGGEEAFERFRLRVSEPTNGRTSS